MECIIYEGSRPTGRLTWRSDGLRWHFQAKLVPYEGVRYLWMTDPRGVRLRLGVPQPVEGGMALERTLTQQSLGDFTPEEPLDVRLRGSDEAAEPVSAPEPSQERLEVFRENGRLYIGEPFRSGEELILSAAFRRMVFREVNGTVYWVMEVL